jgi:hypothetical protein
MISAGIFGPKLSGKTTLAIHLSREYYKQAGIRSLVFDPHRDVWGNQAWVTNNAEEFWATVWRMHSCLVIVDEAALTINRDKDLVPVFTMLRHNRHKLIIIGHSGVDLLPSMRQNLDTLFLFRQPAVAAKIWVETFANEKLWGATELARYEFLQSTLFGETEKKRLQV